MLPDILLPATYQVENLSAFALGSFLIILSPGPNSFFAFSSSAQKGWRAGFYAAAGIIFAEILQFIAVGAGIEAVIKSMPTLFKTLSTCGALYLAWMGFELIRAGIKRYRSPDTVDVSKILAQFMKWHPFWGGFAVSISNVQAILFFLLYFVQFMNPLATNPTMTLVYLVCVYLGITQAYLLFLMTVGRIGQSFSAFLRRHYKVIASLWMLVGAAFMLIAGKIIVSF